MKNLLSTLTTIVLTLCALVITGILVRREFFASPSPTQGPHDIEHWQELAAGGHRMGAANAAVQILEFSDFQCPFCAKLEPRLHAIRAKYPNRVAVVYRHFPLDAHPHAAQAALASECAAVQGRFEPYHDALFAAQDSIGVTTWDQFARRAGIPAIDAFHACVESKQYAGKVDQDAAAALSIAAVGTPTLIVNGRMFSDALSQEQLDTEVQRALRN